MSYGLSYMGSKAGVIHLIQYIIDRHYDKKYFIDVFTGGFACSHYVLKNSNKKVVANDLNKYVIALYEELFYNKSKLFNKVKFDFITREEFVLVRDNPENYDDWYVGYVLTLWSFGNNQSGYLYGKDIEQKKYDLHQAIVFDIHKDFIPSKLVLETDYKVNHEKRLMYVNELRDYNSNSLIRLQNIERLERLQNIERLERLQNIERLERLQWQDFIKSVPDDILKDAIIYCDPPYEDTAEYQAGRGFDHEEFWQWFRDCPYAVYVSSYKAPDDIKPLNFEYKINSLSANNRDVMTENLYWNGKGDAIPTMEDLLFNE